MKETLRIGDEAGLFLFKNLRDIKVDASGDVFVQGEDQILHFDAHGCFICNLAKKGEGPGEVRYMGDYQFDGDTCILSGMMPLKIMIFNKDDKLVREIKPAGSKPFATYLLTLGGLHYVTEDDLDFQKVKTGLNVRHHQVLSVDNQGKAVLTPLTFSTREAIITIRDKERNVMMMNQITRLLTACDGQKYLYAVDGDRYRVRQIDLPALKEVGEFKTEYVPIPFVPLADRDDRQKKMDEMTAQKTFNDIWALRCLGLDLLVFTSQIDPKHGVRVDRFNADGKLTDSVYLKVPGVKRPEDLKNKPLFFHGDDFWTAYVDEDDNPVATKYSLDW